MSNTWKTTINDIVQVDQTTFDFPRNTTWDSPQKLPNQHEPYSPLPVTLDMVQNPENNDQNSPGGFPGRFCQKPKSIWFSNSGEITDALKNMWKNKKASLEFPLAGSSVDGRTVRNEVPNQSSIGASLDDYTILKGIREVPFSAFIQMPALSYYSTDEENRTKELAEQIKQTGEITPLIVAVDNQGPYILEGGHRFDALRELGANSFPAMVVLDNESLNREAAINSLTREITASYTHAYWLDPNGKVFQVRGEDENEIIKSLNRSDQDTHSAWILRTLDMLQKDYDIDPKSLSGTSRSLVELGWTRIGDAYGTDWGIDVTNTDNIPSFVDDVIAQFAPEGAKITVAGPGSSRYQHSQSGYTFEWPVKSIQQTVNRIKQRGQYYQDKPVMAKQAGSYSSTYSDEQGNEFKNEQLYDGVDDVPYIDKNNRDYPFGMRDMNDSSTDYPKPEDIQPYVVRLDILYPGPDRPFPFGMPDYETTIYPWTYAAGDGIEATNPD